MKTTMLDIYEAAGGKVNEERTEVSINPSHMKPFDIKLRVFPQTIKMDDGHESVVFAVLLNNTVAFTETLIGHMYNHREWLADIELPIEQVQILKVAE